MKKVLIISLGIVCLSMLLVYSLQVWNKNSPQNIPQSDTSSAVVIPFDSAKGGFSSNVEATYSDMSRTLKDMKKSSDSIILGKVVEQKQYSDVSVASTVEVDKTYKGKSYDTVTIFQLGKIGDNSILTVDSEYVLFLGFQFDASKNDYYIKGGEQGAFKNEDGKITIKDMIIKEDFEKERKLINKNSDFDILIDIIGQ